MTVLFCNFQNNLGELSFLLYYQSEAGSRKSSGETSIALFYFGPSAIPKAIKYTLSCKMSSLASLPVAFVPTQNYVLSIAYFLTYSTSKGLHHNLFFSLVSYSDSPAQTNLIEQISNKLRVIDHVKLVHINITEEIV